MKSLENCLCVYVHACVHPIVCLSTRIYLKSHMSKLHEILYTFLHNGAELKTMLFCQFHQVAAQVGAHGASRSDDDVVWWSSPVGSNGCKVCCLQLLYLVTHGQCTVCMYYAGLIIRPHQIRSPH